MTSPTREMTASDIHDVYRMDPVRPAKPAPRKRKVARKTAAATRSRKTATARKAASH